jgi:hypothetical protein
METSLHQFEPARPVLSYASPDAKAPARIPHVPWLAIASGLTAWIPVLLSLVSHSPNSLVLAPMLGVIGLIIATMCVIDPDDRPIAYHVTAGLSLLSTLAGTIVALVALLS